MSPAEEQVAETFRRERPYLVAMAARMLHGTTEAEDVVQDAFRRLASHDHDQIDDLRGWLMVVVRRLCLDRLASAHSRRDSPVGWFGDHERTLLARGAADPAQQITLDDEVQLALALVLDQLSPAERTSFVLHDVFGYPFDAIGELVGRTATACRQLASRARRTIQSTASATPPAGRAIDVDRQRVVAERFIAACAGGEIADLLDVLDPDVVGVAVLEGRGPFVRVEGRDAVAKRVLQLFGPGTAWSLIPVPFEESPGIVAVHDGRSVAMFRLDERDGVVHHFHGFVRRPPSA